MQERSLLDQAFSRAAGTHRIGGNAVRLLRDAAESYPAWLDAIAGAERYVHFESYIIRDDASGRRFADALTAKARTGVRVRVLYDWMGAVGKTPSRFWKTLRAAGVEVRCFNPLRLASPLGWVHRDHRKSLVVDGMVGHVTGLCVGDAWVGDPARGIAPWRDTGVELRGPAVAEIERAFERTWAVAGPPLVREREPPGPAGDVAVRIEASEPAGGAVLRLDELVAAAARETLWLCDAYFAGLPTYVQALRAAALDGVEADGRWARVGSSNLNVASWIGNYELDAVMEDVPFGERMMRQYETDLGNATEVHLHQARTVERARPQAPGAGSAGRAAAGALRIGNTVSAAVAGHRVLAPADARILAVAGLALLMVAVGAAVWPRVLAWPLVLLLVWLGGALLARAARLWRERPR